MSHESSSKPLLRQLRARLPNHVTPWIDENEIQLGEDLTSSIKNAINCDVDFLVVFLTQGAVDSAWVTDELKWALQQEARLGRVFVLPVLFDGTSLPPHLGWIRDRKYLSCHGYDDRDVEFLAQGLADALFAWLSRDHLGRLQPGVARLTSGHEEGDVGRGEFISWPSAQVLLNQVFHEFEADFQPDWILTMSGPGGVAACYLMALNPRDVPVLFAVTFPKRRQRTASERNFNASAGLADWQVLETQKWRIYLPNIVSKFSRLAKILIFDDRVISGDSQRAAEQVLRGFGHNVKRAAMLASPQVAKEMDYVGRITDSDYQMPWGPKNGRFRQGR